KFANLFKSYNDILIDSADVSDKNVKKILDNYADALVETNEITKKNYDQFRYNYEQFVNNIINYIQNNKINITDLIEKEDVERLVKCFCAVKGNVNAATKTVYAFSNSLKDAKSELKDNILVSLDLDKAIEKINNAYKETEKDLKLLNQVLNEIEKG